MSELPPHHEDHPDVISRNAQRGLFLFCIYLLLFGSFLLLNIFSPETMAKTTITKRNISMGGPNLAVVYGIGLIFAAIFLSLIYMRLTRKPE